MATMVHGSDAHNALAQAAAGGGEAPVWTGRLIGELVIREVRDAIRIPAPRLREAWLAAGLSEAWISQKKGSRDAFNRATPKDQKLGAYTFMPYHGPARVEGMQRAAVLIRSDDAAERVGKEHLELGFVMLDAGDRIRFEHGPDLLRYPDLEAQAEAFVETIRRDYQRFLGAYDGKDCGRMVARALAANASLEYHAGCYVLPLRNKRVVDALEQIFTVFDEHLPAGSQPNVLHRIPYPETARTREQVRNVLREHIRAEAAGILVEAREFVAKGGSMATAEGGKPPRGDRHKAKTIMGKLADLHATLKAYEEQLRESQSEARLLLATNGDLIKTMLGARPAAPAPSGDDIFL
jgi:hypothetical protein